MLALATMLAVLSGLFLFGGSITFALVGLSAFVLGCFLMPLQAREK